MYQLESRRGDLHYLGDLFMTGPAYGFLLTHTTERFCLILGALLCSLPMMVAGLWATEVVTLCVLVGVIQGELFSNGRHRNIRKSSIVTSPTSSKRFEADIGFVCRQVTAVHRVCRMRRCILENRVGFRLRMPRNDCSNRGYHYNAKANLSTRQSHSK